ncbi:MAG: hypothetical protein J6K48_01170 [Lachnospiraceae bacterium]|nr:hypothetical protein [Lachnospiraceae bacterium]
MGKTGRSSISGAVLKVIACVSMLIDHFSVIVLWNYIQKSAAAGGQNAQLEHIYHVGRAIGRIAFVLFAYLIVEGFLHTRSRGKFLLRLGVFALISEIPYDLAFGGQCFDWSSQNVFFTLFLGVTALTVWEWIGKYAGEWCQCIAVVVCGLAAYYMKTDYLYTGVLLIFVLYLMHDIRLVYKMAVAAVVLLLGTWSMNCLRYGESFSIKYLFRFSLREMYGIAAFFPIALYDGSRGRQLPKWFWYGFYPAHILLLYGIAGFMRVL